MIEKLLTLIKTPLADLIKARNDLTERYRGQKDKRMKTLAEKESYLLTRFPATFKVAEAVFSKIPFPIDSLLDVGSGPATASLAALSAHPLSKITCIEQDKTLLEWAKAMVPLADCRLLDFTRSDFPSAEAVVFSYSIGEIQDPIPIIEKGYNAASKVLIIIEPGTPRAYLNLMKMRSRLIELGASIIAPCPHLKPCPLKGEDWCHFSERVQRTRLHKMLKEADLGYEDEKYCYLIVSKLPFEGGSRIIRPIERHSGHLKMTLCTLDGIQEKTFTRSMDGYSSLKKLDWGQSLPQEF
ncbi:MAG: small ribosomal subunit Rsm22 family protein [Parachlamydiaceae bacterium]